MIARPDSGAQESAPVSVVIPTVGRPSLLAECLGSLEACVPPPAEVLVVDQSGDPAVAEVVGRFPRARLLTEELPNVARARNAGLRAARHDIVLFTDDDCTVAESWAGTALELMRADRNGIVTGRVLAVGTEVASIRESEERQDHSGELRGDALYTGNAAVPRDRLLEFGAFDERFAAAAEDLDLCYRWLRAGRRISFEPGLVVWHHSWKTPEELASSHRGYWRERGVFYGKHLRRGDPVMLRFIARDTLVGLIDLLRAPLRREPTRPIATSLRLLIAGVISGLRRA
jgi:GT2 family glycosyltransferase